MRRVNNVSLPSPLLNRLMAVRPITFNFVKLIIGLSISLGALFSQALLAATCKYEIVDDWNVGFQARVSIINESPGPVNDWAVSWAWDDGTSLENGWNAVYDCNAGACTATGPHWAINVDANQTFTFGFIGKKGTPNVPADASIVLNGDACESNTQAPETPKPSDNVVAMMVPIIALLLDEPAPNKEFWTLDGAQSSVQYVSVKNSHAAEVNRFAQGAGASSPLKGSIDSSGNAVLSIDLNGVDTGVDIRNQRMLDFVFETQLLPTAYISVKLDPDLLSSMQVGNSEIQSITGKLSLHGVSQEIDAEVIVAKSSETNLAVSTVKPILIDSKNFEFASGVGVLRNIANLDSIGEVVPVYFRLNFEVNDNPNARPLRVASEPAAPTNLVARFTPASSRAFLNWRDNSRNESGFIVRRKTAEGLWSTVSNLLSNSLAYNEVLTDAGSFDYKLIAVNGSIPSTPSNIVRLEVTDSPAPDPTAVGRGVYEQQCIGCHGRSGEGVGSFPAINLPRDLDELADYIAEFMPLGNPRACDLECASQVALYLETFWGGGSGPDPDAPNPDPNPDETACRANNTVNYGARQLKILTRSEYQRSVEDLLGVNFNAAAGLSEDDKIGLFANNTHTSIVSSSYSNFLLVAEEIAQWSAARDFAPAISCNAFDQNCADTFISQLAPRIFRRPLNAEEIEAYSTMADGDRTGGNVKEGMAMALEAMLSAPQFLYRHELGEPNPNNPRLDNDAFELTSYEMATFLAYTFTGSTPDQQLLNAASNDLLRNDAEILRQAERLSRVAQAKDILGDFVGSWLGTDDLDIAAKDESVWPGFDALVPHMKQEVRENFASIMLDPSESFSSLYNADFSYLNQTLAQHYGISGVSGNQMRRVATSERGGILASGGFMARWGEAEESSPIIRSVRVRRRMLCQDELPNPPAGTFAAREARLAQLSEILRNPTTTNRLKTHLLTEGSPCSSCHLEYINPLGFGMEDFDTVGRLRLTDLNGNSIDAAGQLFAPTNYNDLSEIEAFTGTKGLAQLMSTLPAAQSCLSKQMFRYVTGVGYKNIDVSNPEAPGLAEQEREGYACEIENLTQAMMEDSPKAMFERFSTLDAVRYRKAWARQ